MYIRVTTGRFNASSAQEIQDLVAEKVLAVGRTLPGFGSYYGGIDRKGNRLVAISTWETEDQALKFRDQLGADILNQLKDLGPSPGPIQPWFE
jgi:hypothetical protein